MRVPENLVHAHGGRTEEPFKTYSFKQHVRAIPATSVLTSGDVMVAGLEP